MTFKCLAKGYSGKTYGTNRWTSSSPAAPSEHIRERMLQWCYRNMHSHRPMDTSMCHEYKCPSTAQGPPDTVRVKSKKEVVRKWSNDHMSVCCHHLIVTIEYKCYQPQYCTPWRWRCWAHGRTVPPSPASPCLCCIETAPACRSKYVIWDHFMSLCSDSL